MRNIYIILILLFITLSGQSQVNQYGYPLHTYFGSDILNSSAQNWGIVQVDNGLLYIANNLNGVLEYDGEETKHINIEGNPEVRAIAINDDGFIFIGCSNEFGYLRPNILGKFEYINLSERLPDSINNFSFIYNVNCIADTVYFSDDRWSLFKYITTLDTLIYIKNKKNTLFNFNYNDIIYGGSYTDGLFKIVRDSSVLVPNGIFFKYKNIFSILNDNNKKIIVTGNSGVFEFDESEGAKQVFTDRTLTTLKDVVLYSADLNSESYFFGTIGNGINVVDKDGNIEAVLDKKVGIKDHICSSVNSNNNILWGTLTLGISGVEYKNPIRYFSEESNLSSWINDIISFDNKLFVATDIGVFYRDVAKEETTFEKVNGISNQVWSLNKMNIDSSGEEFLVIGTSEGLFQLNNVTKSVFLIERNLLGLDILYPDLNEQELKTSVIIVWKLFSSKENNKLWVSTSKRFFSIIYKNGQWAVENPSIDIDDKIKDIIEDELGNLWISTTANGVFFYNAATHQLINKNQKLGLLRIDNIRISTIDKQIILATPNGIYQLDIKNDTIYLISELPKQYNDSTTVIKNILQLSNSKIVVNIKNNNQWSIESHIKVNGNYSSCDFFLKRLSNIESEALYEFNNRVWFANGNTLYNYPIESKFQIDSDFNCLVRKVEGYDTVYFSGTYFKETPTGIIPSNIQNDVQKPILDYSDNNLTFYFAAPYFEGVDEIEYSYQLDGFKDEWSRWNKEPKAVFTNLNEGQYTFKVKAINIYDNESTVGEYSFAILPPWYKTILAFIIYVILIIFFIVFVVKIYTRRLEQEKIHLEGIVRERTSEIREQRDEIAEQKQSIEDSILYARRIQRAILPSEELAQEILPKHFILFRPRDVVSGDYFWMNKIGNRVVLVAADCTGHGVPGAFMSMLGVSFLNEIVLKENIIEPHLILNKLRTRVKNTLKQEGKEGEAKDGMDVALVVIDYDLKKLYFSGAYNPLYIYRDSELFEIKADRMPIGIFIKEKDSFTLNEYDYKPGDTFYIFSDGYPDQFGGPKNQKFRTKAMKQLLSDIQPKSMPEQHEILNTTIEKWMAESVGQDQIDDMVVIGVRM